MGNTEALGPGPGDTGEVFCDRRRDEGEMEGLRDIGKVVDQIKGILDGLLTEGQVRINATISHPALKEPICINAGIPLPGQVADVACDIDYVGEPGELAQARRVDDSLLDASYIADDNFLSVITELHSECEHSCSSKDNAKMAMAIGTAQDNPLLWRVLRRRAARMYRRDTGATVTRGFDWDTIKDWLRDNWPAIMKGFLTIIMMFFL